MRKVILAALCLLALTACEPLTATPEPTTTMVTLDTTPNEVTVPEANMGESTAVPPTKMHVIMVPTGDPAARCTDLGGTFDEEISLCRDVDY